MHVTDPKSTDEFAPGELPSSEDDHRHRNSAATDAHRDQSITNSLVRIGARRARCDDADHLRFERIAVTRESGSSIAGCILQINKLCNFPCSMWSGDRGRIKTDFGRSGRLSPRIRTGYSQFFALCTLERRAPRGSPETKNVPSPVKTL